MIIRKAIVSSLLLLLISLTGFGQCGSDPTSGLYTVNSGGQVLNSYYPGTGNPTAGATSMTLGAMDARGNAVAFANGDLVLILQMQGAEINAANTDAYGNGVSGGN
ncbi:MAG: hypothetical protein ABJA78_19515, partial [Ferruginibacter sp.]